MNSPELALPSVSVVLLSWNHEAFARAAVDSITSQSHPKIELISVDNGSFDASAEIIASAARSSGIPFTQIRNSSNRGIAAALNQGLGEASAEFVITFSADDVMLSHRVATQTAALQGAPERFAAVCGDMSLIDSTGAPLTDEFGNQRTIATPFLADEDAQPINVIRRRQPLAPTVMLRRSVFGDLGRYDPTLPVEDYPFWLRLVRRYRFLYLPGVVSQYRRHGSNTSGNVQFLRRAALDCLVRFDATGLGPDAQRALTLEIENLERLVDLHEALDPQLAGQAGARTRLWRIASDRNNSSAMRAKALGLLLAPHGARRRILSRRAV